MRTARRAWAEVTPALRDEVEQRLGSPVREVEDRRGGFSWGVVGVAALADGEQVFVKAIQSSPDAVGDHRAEVGVSARLPAAVPAPRLRFGLERDGWLLRCFDLAPGVLPHEPWLDHELAAALAMLDACAEALTPSPITGVPTVAARMAGRCETWRALERDGTHDVVSGAALGAWEREHLRLLAAIEARWAELVVGDTLLHFDPRFDNILIDDHGTARLVDWSRACTGPAWVDLVCLLMESDLGARDPQEIFLASAAGRDADPLRVDAFLVALGGYWTHTAALPGPAHAPHLRERREHSRRATMSWLRSRWAADGAAPTVGAVR
ncbi:hypothetical protein GCM10010404_49610 [Nonomuraea africana]|uniref:Aminoglycoside phosphotransferase domain-containing protein n=1 Tax=Nonomuraea africana TaxID=46171 RepID=A0ABR9KVK4_9ACTN|nr:phosphotransferase [Nonomuraea africana]MBE1566071.1 hypothetical protein [Nonomuraea africana]